MTGMVNGGQGRAGQGGERGQGAKSEGCRWVVRVSVRLCPVPFTLPLPTPLLFHFPPSFSLIFTHLGKCKIRREVRLDGCCKATRPRGISHWKLCQPICQSANKSDQRGRRKMSRPWSLCLTPRYLCPFYGYHGIINTRTCNHTPPP